MRLPPLILVAVLLLGCFLIRGEGRGGSFAPVRLLNEDGVVIPSVVLRKILQARQTAVATKADESSVNQVVERKWQPKVDEKKDEGRTEEPKAIEEQAVEGNSSLAEKDDQRKTEGEWKREEKPAARQWERQAKPDDKKEEPKTEVRREESRKEETREESKVPEPKEESKVEEIEEEKREVVKAEEIKEEPKVEERKAEPKVQERKEEPKVEEKKTEPEVQERKEEAKMETKEEGRWNISKEVDNKVVAEETRVSGSEEEEGTTDPTEAEIREPERDENKEMGQVPKVEDREERQWNASKEEDRTNVAVVEENSVLGNVLNTTNGSKAEENATLQEQEGLRELPTEEKREDMQENSVLPSPGSQDLGRPDEANSGEIARAEGAVGPGDGEFTEDYPDFLDELRNFPETFQKTAEIVKDHIKDAGLERYSTQSRELFDQANQQMQESFAPLLGKAYAPFLAYVVSYGLLLLPLVLVMYFLERIRAKFSLQKILLFVNIYLAAYSAALMAATFLLQTDPMDFFMKYSSSSYIFLQVVQALGFVMYLLLNSVDLISTCSNGRLPAKFSAFLQWVVVVAVGFHYYVTVFHRAMTGKPPLASWRIYGLYSVCFVLLCLFTRVERGKKRYKMVEEDDPTDKKN